MDRLVLISIDMLVCGIAFSAIDRFVPSATAVLALTFTQSNIFADINKNMFVQNGNSDLLCHTLIERHFIIPICI